MYKRCNIIRSEVALHLKYHVVKFANIVKTVSLNREYNNWLAHRVNAMRHTERYFTFHEVLCGHLPRLCRDEQVHFISSLHEDWAWQE